jgi:RNA polymerase sigma-70 factor (ECF subfamily)
MDEWTGAQMDSETEYLGAAVATAPEPNLRAEFGANLEANYPRLVSQLCMITLSPAEAQDLVQEAYARAWQRWSDIRELRDPTQWVRQMAVRGSSRRWRRLLTRLGIGGRRTNESPSDDPRHAAVLSALAKMPPYRRRVLVLGDVAQLPIHEVAEIEGISPGVAEARLTHARRELNELLAVHPPSAPPAANWEDM